MLQDTEDGIAQSIAVGGTHRQALPQPVPVFIVYQTVFLDGDGTIGFRRDVYERDEEIWRSLVMTQQVPLAEQIPSPQRGG